MSTSNDAPEDFVATNDQWSGIEMDYASGMFWPNSMFPSVPRDSRFYGSQDPLDLVPPPGPFDDEHGDEAWRKSEHGTVIYTGEENIKTLRPPTAVESARRQQFWDTYEARARQPAEAQRQDWMQGQVEPAACEEQCFPDVLPARSETAPALLAQHQIFTPVPRLPSLPEPQAPARVLSAPAPAPVPTSSPAASISAAHHLSDVDGEYELDDDYLPDAPQGPPTSTNPNEQEQVPNRTPPRTSSPRSVNDWDDANLLNLWKHKVIRKKGYEPILTSFKDQTVEGLHEAWMKHKERCKQLGVTWEAAGKPTAPLSEWFEG
ncbi:hypothetical protein N0V86_007310 [Didymella sp. IMI 355093]|nr:hypothetical protein N0V86_007310 [Didymella sp. IMI 355093]